MIKLEQNIPQEIIKKEWKKFINGEKATQIRPEILRAWKRCKKNGIDPMCITPKRITDPAEIRNRLEKNEKLLKVSGPAIKYLYSFTKGLNFFVSVSDTDGYLLLVYGDTEILEKHEPDGILYTNWSEKHLGNTPIGTCLVENRPVQVFGYEHYCKYPHHFYGAAIPIHNPQNEIIGAISISGITDNINFHTLGIIVMTAYGIEKQLKIMESMEQVEKEKELTGKIIASIQEGIMVIDKNNRIKSVNSALCHMLHIHEKEMLGKNIRNFFKEHILIDIIYERSNVTDYVTEISVNQSKFLCTVTFIEHNNSSDALLVINDMARMQSITKKASPDSPSITFDNIIGGSTAFSKSVELAKSVASTDSTVLLLGESGTGKDMFAQAIHNYSGRKNGPFIPINCGAIPKDLITSELFGYEEGAFTGAKKGGNIGQFEQANNGTIFLDEIGEMPMELQSTLLRVIEQKVISRVGGRNYIPVNVRIIAATNKDLLHECDEGRFRYDLYYRLNILSLNLIPLRDRKDDIYPLVKSFLNKLSIKYGKFISDLTDESWGLVMDYDWPGNVRELHNAVERAVALSKEAVITPELLPFAITNFKKTVIPTSTTHSSSLKEEKIRNEKSIISEALAQNYWNISQTAKELGISRMTLYRKIDAYGIKNK